MFIIFLFFQCQDASGFFSVASYPIYEEISGPDPASCLLQESTEFPDFSSNQPLQPLILKSSSSSSQYPRRTSQTMAVVNRKEERRRPLSQLPPRPLPSFRKNPPKQNGAGQQDGGIFSVQSNVSHYESVPVPCPGQTAAGQPDQKVKSISHGGACSPTPAPGGFSRSQTCTSFASSNQTISTSGSDT